MSTHFFATLSRGSFFSLLFLLSLTLLIFSKPNSSYSGLHPTQKRYLDAKNKLASLNSDPQKARHRDSWEQVIAEFMAIYNEDPKWNNRPAVLFRVAEATEGLAKHSFNKADAQKAAETYEKVANNYKNSCLADDALLCAAKIYVNQLGNEKKALSLLARIKKDYPKSDSCIEASAFENTLKNKESAAKNSPEPKQTEPQAKTTDQNNEQLYQQLKQRMQTLSKDPTQSCWRGPWENLEAEFLKVHKNCKNKIIAAGSLYRAAMSRYKLAQCTQSKKDYQRAVELYQSIQQSIPESPIADDGMLAAAKIQLTNLNQKRQAQALLSDLLRRYPAGDMAKEARNRLNTLTAKAPQTKPVELQVLSWDSLDKNRVKVTLELTGETEYSAKLVTENKGKLKRLYLDLNDTNIAESIRKGIVIKGSLLQGIFVEKKNKQTVLRFDLRDARRFDVTKHKDNTLEVLIDARKNVVPRETTRGGSFAENESTLNLDFAKPSSRTKIQQQNAKPVNDFAKQLGLSVHTIFIDAGHGGKDPGTYHNNVVERLVTLDVAKTLGRLLQNNGFNVIYSRTTDTFIPLSNRTRAANAAHADLFISIHVNANDDTSVAGLETYYLDLSKNPDAARVAALENVGSDRRLADMQKLLAEIMLTARVDESSRLAIDVQRLVLSRLKRNSYFVNNNGIKSAPFHVLIGAQMPAILIELGYCTNFQEAKNLADKRYREILAEGIAEGITRYRDRLQQNQRVENLLTPVASGAM